jgi:hypothetical protein
LASNHAIKTGWRCRMPRIFLPAVEVEKTREKNAKKKGAKKSK